MAGESDFDIRREETDPKLLRLEEDILNHHKGIAKDLLEFRDRIENQMTQKDPAGWRIYGFDPKQVTPRQVMDIDPNKVLNKSYSEMEHGPEPAFEINFYPASDNEIPERSRPASIGILISQKSAIEKGQLELFPKGSETVEFTRLTIDVPNPSVQRLTWPAVISEVTHVENPMTAGYIDSVTTRGIPVSKTEETAIMAQASLSEMAKIVQELATNNYHLRIFGNSHNSPVKPRFMLHE
ncbi:MAG: hypothetical protein A2857_02615 [Candidatus Levybacteria bacterium RIFCSPHIGHO2_01_FULL_36_15]|nr:MAG: hypothetical protein A2857_02615 [Candidatus Levybacteria bacterium RIFCSPHIGHO2_01_FULL_36_15]OGH38880.1 MAG: hypothetical protein A2905_04330 [Candidatus Levybacteria bacterium RIFCSPLOWO2_01_FULL_36_10]